MTRIKTCLSVLAMSVAMMSHAVFAETYEPTQASVSKHPLPEWYQDAKFGIIIHYGIYSVPGWAPVWDPTGKVGTKEFFLNNPYPEWYSNTLQIPGSPTSIHHLLTYGANVKYDDFAPIFNKKLQQWNPDAWSELFSAAGAKYIVFVTKHHDGFLLWPSQYRNPAKPDFVASRDVVGELTQSVRKHGMHMALYYSGGYDWGWPNITPGPIADLSSSIKKIPQSQDYADYVDHQWHELIEKYHPDLLWNDIALPEKVNKWKLFADYYNANPDGVVNNRWGQGSGFDFSAFGQPDDALIDSQLRYDWFDYYSPEYLTHYKLTKHKWEADHGLGYSFGYNQEEFLHPEHLKTLDQFIVDLADLVSKNGNLLLGIGPEADGTIPDIEKNLLLGMGDWLTKNGEGIYATRPWLRAEGVANNGSIDVRFTQSKDGRVVYAILLTNPKGKDVTINQFNLPVKKVDVLNGKDPIEVPAQVEGNDIVVHLSQGKNIPMVHPLVLKIILH